MDAGIDMSRAYRAGGQHQLRQLDRVRNPTYSQADTRTRCISSAPPPPRTTQEPAPLRPDVPQSAVGPPAPPSQAARPPKLLDRLREALRSRHYSRRTEESYCYWAKRFIFFHHVRHPVEMAEPEINAFLTYLAVKEKVSASTQTQALSALLFLYRHVLGREIGVLEGLIRARKPRRLPVVMTREEVKQVLGHLKGERWLMLA